MTWLIRRGLPGDEAVISEFNRRLAQETEGKHLDPETLRAGVQAALTDPNRGVYFVACNGQGEIVGQLMITLEWSDWRNGWRWWIQSVYVRADHRRQGVFRALFNHVVQEARRRSDVACLRLYVEQENQAAQKTYQRLGMSATGYLVLERGLPRKEE